MTKAAAAGEIYGLNIYESNELVKEYKPIVTNGVAGLVDVLHPSAVRYASTYGSGYSLMFSAGGDFACVDGSDEAYLEFGGPGNSPNRIDTGVVVTKVPSLRPISPCGMQRTRQADSSI